MPAWAAALTGLVAGAVALGVAQIVAGLIDPAAAPVVAVGGAMVDATPAGLKEWAIRTFGSNDKPVLLGGIVVVLALVAAGLGLLARRRTAYGTLGLAVFGLVGAAAALSRPDAGVAHVLPSLVGAAAGAWTLPRLKRRALSSGEEDYVAASRAADRAEGGRVLAAPAPADSTRAAGEGSRAAESGPAPSPGRPPAPSPAQRSVPSSARQPAPSPAMPAVMRAGMGLGTGPGTGPGTGSGAGSGVGPGVGSDAVPYAFDRRRLLTGAAAGVAVAGVAGFGGWLLKGSKDAELARRGVSRMLPRAARPAAPIPAGADLRIPGLSPFVTPNADFYRVDTALVVPSVDPARWTLKIHGLVDRPVELTFADLLKRPLMEADVTLTCVSNEVGGPYIGNARWLGARLADVLREAGIRREADMLLSVSEDGWTCGTPVDVVMDGRDALLAVAMNGEVLPESHGFPVRQVVPGLYGYVSATKWVTEIRVTRFDQDEAYWTPRGWAPKGPIKTQSRIDLPRDGDDVTLGRTTVAGVAWAQHRGVDAVEVRVDGGAWQQARLAQVPGPDTWRQWSLDLVLTPGRHTIAVRATDASGYTQTADEAPPAPDGATGFHTITVTAR
ncbi:molybdopterin-dependent oxidoreductase [Microbispora hainanensis]|uniref:Molybdopterin-dependent oxidoreductase n=2 Tax=Microbispora hainanensis TaxID=568844 RepID=A0A544YX72_9ACTN|nr:molybdopterin-dependent oxidoreductase [Microbispora hainanensis]TQS21359.1 molybdopterin-dependent oxidoreductase [Microbispora hainanensis]